MDFSYHYAGKGCERQYDGQDIRKPVEAVYIQSVNPIAKGNPFAEALPRARTREELVRDCKKGVPEYSKNKAMKMTTQEKQAAYTAVKHWRYILPFQYSLETQFALALQISYCNRTAGVYQTGDGDMIQLSTDGVALNEPVMLLGVSGKGKTCSLQAMLSGYPQVILHDFDGIKMSQIVYIYAVCPPNSNLGTLFETIAMKIDLALGYGNSLYREMVRKARNLGAKASIITGLINQFAIGAIILDEIQSLDMGKTKESSIDYLLSIVNDTGVNICIAGTEEGYENVFRTRKIERRTGVDPSEGMNYYENEKFFAGMLKDLFQYQWFDYRVKLDDEMIDAFYEYTSGIADDIVKLYIYLHKDYLDRPEDRRPKVDAAFIRKTAEKYFPRRQRLLDDAFAGEMRALRNLMPDSVRYGAKDKKMTDKENLPETLRKSLTENDYMEAQSV